MKSIYNNIVRCEDELILIDLAYNTKRIETIKQSILKLKDNDRIFVNDIKNWSYKLPSTKYNVIDAKLEDLLVED